MVTQILMCIQENSNFFGISVMYIMWEKGKRGMRPYAFAVKIANHPLIHFIFLQSKKLNQIHWNVISTFSDIAPSVWYYQALEYKIASMAFTNI